MILLRRSSSDSAVSTHHFLMKSARVACQICCFEILFPHEVAMKRSSVSWGALFLLSPLVVGCCGPIGSSPYGARELPAARAASGGDDAGERLLQRHDAIFRQPIDLVDAAHASGHGTVRAGDSPMRCQGRSTRLPHFPTAEISIGRQGNENGIPAT